MNAPLEKTYIDLFAGCGGLSLGLRQAGWAGVFAIERSEMAFETLQHNLIDNNPHFPHWPSWLPKQSTSIQQLIDKYSEGLEGLRGKVTLIAGGPPCQGFSPAGRREKNDHRNQLYRSYLKVVRLVRPTAILLENVTGIKMRFGEDPGKRRKPGRPQIPYSERLKAGLSDLGYKVFDSEVVASDFGVPQTRRRFVAIGVHESWAGKGKTANPFDILNQVGTKILSEKGLPVGAATSARNALSDLEYVSSAVISSPDSKGFLAGTHGPAVSAYQKLMRGVIEEGATADSHRFVNHRPHIVARFSKILRECPRGKNLSDELREKYSSRKACVVPLDADKPAVTLTTIPDDMIHYSQPRVLTVRECARLQSFPDWFAFRSKYTTGGERRKKECPRYTQVGNAVPPLLGEALGRAVKEWIAILRPESGEASRSAA